MNSNHRHGNSANWFLTGIFLLTLVVGSFVVASCEEDQPEEQPAAAAESEESDNSDESSAEETAETGEPGDDEAVVGEAPPLGRNVALAKNSFAPGERIEVSYKAEEWFDSTAWLGVVPADIPHGSEAENDLHDIEYRYLDGASGVLNFTAPDKPGEYDMRLHSSDDNGKEVASINFTVR